MLPILWDQRARSGDDEFPTLEQMTQTYSNLVNCDPNTDIALIEDDNGQTIGYLRALWTPTVTEARALEPFRVISAAHARHDLLVASLTGLEEHMRSWAVTSDDIFRGSARHPGQGQPPSAESFIDAVVFEELGYAATQFGAALVRPNLDDISERTLPDGVELRPVSDDQLRTIFDHHCEAFRGDWNFHEVTEDDWREFSDDPHRDTSLWKIAWVGDTPVGQVKSFVNADENERLGRKRGYTEYISTHADWRNRGIAGTLLAMSLVELRDRGYTEAALGVDTNNPGGAFQLYQSLGFELREFSATYEKPVSPR